MKLKDLFGAYSISNEHTNMPLTFKSTGSTTVALNKIGQPYQNSFYYTIDNGSWVPYSIGDAISLSDGQMVSFSGTGEYLNKNNDGSDLSAYNFSATGDGTLTLYGNIASLINNSDIQGKNYIFEYLFYNCDKITDASEFVLPYIQLSPGCYLSMFYGCTNLTTSPQLPATGLAGSCYGYMFYNCSSLTSAPILPATTLADRCYQSMFYNCSSLTNAPYLPAKTLVNRCYFCMFAGCTSLSSIEVGFTDWTDTETTSATWNWVYPVAPTGIFTKPDELSAEYGDSRIPTNWTIEGEEVELPQNMLTFISNGSTTVTLSSIGSPDPINMKISKNGQALQIYNLNETISLSDGDYVSFSGTTTTLSKGGSDYYRFVTTGTGKLTLTGSISSLVNGSDTCSGYKFVCLLRDNHNLVDASQLELPYTSASYEMMFVNCTALTAAPSLPATKVLGSGYNMLFAGCTSLSTAPALSAMELQTGCYRSMFRSCTSLTAAPQLPAIKMASACYIDMFANCTSLSTIPTLPATELSIACFSAMFSGCTSLISVSQLNATTLADKCYQAMFYGCTGLTQAPVLLPASDLMPSCYYQMFKGCTNLTDAPKIIAHNLAQDSCDGMFYGCSKLSSIDVEFETWTEGATDRWLDQVAAEGIFKKSPYLAQTFGTSNIPTNWDVQNQRVYDQNYLTFKSTGETIVALQSVGSPNANTFYYNKNNQGWLPYSLNNDIYLNNNDIVAFSGTNHALGKSTTAYYRFRTEGTGALEVMGKVDSLVGSDQYMANYLYYALFSGCIKISNASRLILPSANAGTGSYSNMFAYCTNLKQAPLEIPAMQVGPSACYTMFDYCGLLLNAPNLPATGLANGCYWAIFRHCENLIKAPGILPATTLALNCYRGMFESCTHLTNAPYLPATTLATDCYRFMFNSCTALKSMAVNFTSWGTSNTQYTQNWVQGVPAGGTFYKPAGLSEYINVNHGIMSNWTIDDITNYEIPDQIISIFNPLTFTATGTVSICLSGIGALDSLDVELDYNNSGDWHSYTVNTWITLTNGQEVKIRNRYNYFNNSNSYYYYFQTSGDGTLALSGDINSLVNGNTSVEDYTFAHLFKDCDNITDASKLVLSFNALAKGCYWGMFEGCGDLTMAPVNEASFGEKYSFYEAFKGCTSLTHTLDLNNITDVKEGCYMRMFEDCENLQKASKLPAIELEKLCYYEMFKNCSNLNSINASLQSWTSENATTNWVQNVAEEGMFIGKEGISVEYGPSKIPTNWDIQYLQYDIDMNALTFISKGTTTVKLIKNHGSYTPTRSFYYSKNGQDYQGYAYDTSIVLNDGQVVTFSGVNDVINSTTRDDGCHRFITEGTGTIELIGKLNGICNNYQLSNRNYRYMFSGCSNIADISNLEFPIAPLAEHCYFGTFESCTSLTSIPDNFDFLANMPTSATNCCRAMFWNCTSLSIVPQTLPATTLAPSCYYNMFNGCTSLIKAPWLPANNSQLTLRCYQYMFNGCINLAYMNVNFTGWTEIDFEMPSSVCSDWVYETTNNSNFIFYKPIELSELHASNKIPNGWTVQNKDYFGFKSTGTTKIKLTQVGFPEEIQLQYSVNGSYLSSYSVNKEIELRDGEYISFKNLDTFFSTNSTNYYKFIIEGTGTVELTGKMQSLINYSNDVPNYAFYHLFENCTNIIDAQNSELKVNTVGINSCEAMFKGCTNLTDSPKYYNPSLSTEAFKQMFYGCSRLSSIDVKFVDWTPSNATTNWVSGVATLGIFIKDGMLPIQKGFNYIPADWIDEDKTPLTFKAHGNASVAFCLSGSLDPVDIVYRKNKGGLGVYTVGTYIDLEDGQYVMFRNRKEKPIPTGTFNDTYINSCSPNMYYFSTSGDGNLDVYGNLQSINNYSDYEGDNNYFRLFSLSCNNLADASQLILDKYNNKCSGYFRGMFMGCTSLTAAPQVPQMTVVSKSTFADMFNDCSSLVIPPSKLTPTLYNGGVGGNIFRSMFEDCTSLTAAPEFPTGAIDNNYSRETYISMFKRCRSLLAGPQKIIIKNAQNNICNSMFYGCWSLTGATEIAYPEGSNAGTLGAWNGYGSMYQHCHSLRTPPKWNWNYGSEYMWGMFKDCWSLTAVPDFSSISPNNSKYFLHMFQNCVSLSTVPSDLLPWTNLSSNASYESMFEGCSNLLRGPDLPASTLADGCYKNMFKDCAKLTGLHYGAPSWNETATSGWLAGVSPTGTMTFDYALEDIRDDSHIPVGWNDGIPVAVPANALTFIFRGATNYGLAFAKAGSISGISMYYSKNGGAVQAWPSGWLSAVPGDVIKVWNTNNKWSESDTKYYKFMFNEDNSGLGNVQISGDIKSLINNATTISPYQFKNLFIDMKQLTTASGLNLEYLDLANYCYYNMFQGCSNLTAMPDLPATGLAEGCYWQMFKNCTSLPVVKDLIAETTYPSCYAAMYENTAITTPPVIHASGMASGACKYMFYHCDSLTSTPVLSAMGLAYDCYCYMFKGCHNLISAIDLPATVPARDCYWEMFADCTSLTDSPHIMLTGTVEHTCQYMFSGCTALTSITTDFKSWTDTGTGAANGGGWVTNVSPTGIFHKTAQLSVQRGAHRIPEGWLVDVIDFEILPSSLTFISHGETAIKLSDYNKLFYSLNGVGEDDFTSGKWINLTDGDVLRVANNQITFTGKFATSGTGTLTLSGNCNSLIGFENLSNETGKFSGLFSGCTNIVDASQLLLPSMDLANNCYEGMFVDCTNLTTPPSLPATGLADYCYVNMFVGCHSLTATPVLSANTLANGCYCAMFTSCTSLTDAPVLSATNLTPQCYAGMFGYCTSLTSTPQLPATTLVNNCYQAMFQHCTSLIDGPHLSATMLSNGCYANMFKGCTSLTGLTVDFTDWNDGLYTTNWLYNVASTGTLTKPAALPDKLGYSYVPNGWNGLVSPIHGGEFTIFVNGTGTRAVKITTTGTPYTTSFKYSVGGDLWEDYQLSSVIEFNDFIVFSGQTGHLSKNLTNFYRFQITGNVNIEGNLADLINNQTMSDTHVFANLFVNCNTIKDTSNLVVPSSNLTNACFMQMFSGCTAMTAGVSSLPATTVPISGYQSMFEKCSGMVTGPSILPATTIGQEAYRAMFNECRNMTTPMYLSATSVSTRGLRYMFNNNYKLNYIEVNFTVWGDSNAMANWTAAVGTNGTFVKPAALPPSTGVNYIPATWTIVNK